MYYLINAYSEAVVGAIKQYHVTEYNWLIENLEHCQNPNYQRRYRRYWRMNAARLSPEFYNAYFTALNDAQAQQPAVGHLVGELYQVPAHNNGRQSLQFSFATKLVHMVDPTTPIYDSLIAAFYFFPGVNAINANVEQRIGALCEFHNFLHEEYSRIIDDHLLDPAIEAFRHGFNADAFTDQKVIDSLLWGFVSILRNGGIQQNVVVYE